MTPMIDIVFLLIIFFMTVTQVSKVNKERVDLPDQEGSMDQVDDPVTINIRKSGEIVVSGRVITVPVLVSLVADEVARRGGDPRRIKIVVRGDAEGQAKTLNEITKALGKIEVQNIFMAVENPR